MGSGNDGFSMDNYDKKKNINVGVLIDGLDEWDGGTDLLKAYILPMSQIKHFSVFILFPRFIKEKERDENLRCWLTESKIEAEAIYYGYDWYDLCKTVRKLHIDVIFPTLRDLTEEFPIPWVPYIPDFQHKYFPDFFTSEDLEYRDDDFGKKVIPPRTVMVESESVKKDILEYYPEEKAKIFVMPYTAIPEEEWLDADCVDLSSYNLPGKYFLISNQFWQHKDHYTAFKALEILKNKVPDVYIICTGNTEDNRNPDFFSSLEKMLKAGKIEDRVLFLGFIPKLDQIAIMCGAIAVIQPTLFEGNPGGGIAYNAVSMNVPIILSDIDVNKELIGDNIFFFEKSNPTDLAGKMKALIDTESAYKLKREKLLESADRRLSILTDSVEKMLLYAVGPLCKGYGNKQEYPLRLKRYLRTKIKTFTQISGIYKYVVNIRRSEHA